MSKHLARDLDNLQHDLLAVASAAEEAVHKAIRSLQDRDAELARQVIDGDTQIDLEENHVEEECLKVLALHQPVAVDLRRIAAALKINAELEPFFSDLPARLAQSHLVVARSGAGTVAELAAIGRPSILVPLPGAIDQDQFANAGVLSQADGAVRIVQSEFTPDRLASEVSAFAAEPARLTAMAASARSVGRLDAAERLADLVAKVAGI